MGAKVGEGAGRSDAPAHDAANLLRYFHSYKRPLWMIPRRAKNHARLQCARPAGSSNGRTPDSGSGSWGSNPCPAASPVEIGTPLTVVSTQGEADIICGLLRANGIHCGARSLNP